MLFISGLAAKTRFLRGVSLVALFLALQGALSQTPVKTAQAPGSTNIDVAATVLQPQVTRLGINLSDQDFYDSGQMLKNLVFRNPGFEGEVFRSILVCGSVTANTCTDSDQYSGQETNFWQGGSFQVISGTSMGTTGSVVASQKNPSSCNGCGQIVTFDRNLSLANGDYVIVRNNFPGNPTAGWWPSTSGGGTLTADYNDLSPNTPGKQAIALNAGKTGQNATVVSYFDTWSNRSFLQMNGNFQVTFRAKGTGGANQLSVFLGRIGGTGNLNYVNQTLTLTNSWQDYSLTFAANENGSTVGTAQLSFAAAGSSAYLDDVSVSQTNGDPTNTTAFRDAVVNTLLDLKPGVIRMMGTNAELGADITDQIAVPFARYRMSFATSNTEVDDIPYGIHELLQLCARVGADPWITIPTATTPAEMSQLVQYLSGNGADPYSALRIARGQTQPWTTVFNKVHIELGNELWNGAFAGEIMSYQQYATWANQVFLGARQTSGYQPARYDLVLSGWSSVPWWNTQEINISTNHDSVDIAPYLLYSANNDTIPNLFQSLFAEPELWNSPGGQVYQNLQAVQAAPTPTRLNVYEVNLGTLIGNITQPELDSVMPSVGAGVAVADHMLQMMRNGVAVQNLFALPQLQFGRGDGSTVKLWGSVIDMGGATNRRRPQFLAEQMANSAITGNMLTTTQTGLNPTWNEPLSSDDVQLNGAHEIQSFAFSDGTNSSVVLFNLSLTTQRPITFTGANAPQGTLQVSQLTSANITDSNEDAANVNIATNSMDAASPLSLPPYSMTVLRWNSANAAPSAVTPPPPTLSLPSGGYSTSITVTMTDAAPSASIHYTVDGSTPTPSSPTYTTPLTFTSNLILNAVAVNAGGAPSAVTQGIYAILQPAPATPVVSPASGSFSSPPLVTITDTTKGAPIFYTTDGTIPTPFSARYTGPFTTNLPSSVYAISFAPGTYTSGMGIANYQAATTYAPAPPPAPAPAPTLAVSPAAGTYSTAQQITLAATPAGASIFYTTDGSAPSTASTLYSGPFTLNASATVNAVAIAQGVSSPVQTAQYTIASTAAALPFFPNGFAGAGVNLNVDAQLSGSGLRLTSSNGGSGLGTGWYPTAVPVDGFSTLFTYQALNAVADGFTFTLQNSPQSIYTFGNPGSGLGYGSVPNSVSLGFDFYNQGAGNSTVALFTNGNTSATPLDMAGSGIDFKSGHVFLIGASYQSNNLTLTVTDLQTQAKFTTNFLVNIAATIGSHTALAGFTAGTGAFTASQYIWSWVYNKQ